MTVPLPPAATRRSVVLTLIIIVVFLGLAVEYLDLRGHIIIPTWKEAPPLPALKEPSPLWSPSSSSFWPSFAPILAAASPRGPPPQLKGKASSTVRVGSKTIAYQNALDMDETQAESVRRSHTWFVDQIIQQDLVLGYQGGTRGIVTSAGGAYFPPLLVTLQMLRRTGSTLPVEVFLATPDEYEPLICDTILPSLGAKCVILSNLLDKFILPFSISRYQLKAFAMLFSSFESILFLDADNFPVHPPEELFASEPFISHHLVLWPDYWTPTVSPFFNTITGLDGTLLAERSTIEAGQILLSKPHHSRTLLLAAYYNCYNEYFYHLLSQGGPGEGDKETFAAAALVLDSPFYTVKHGPRPLGIRNDGGAVLESHPRDDWDLNTNHSSNSDPRPFFVHASWPPKLNALWNYRTWRQWGTEEDSKKLFDGEDLEPIAWGFMVEMACREGLDFRDWGNKTEKGVCEQTKKSYLEMFKMEYMPS